MMSLASPQQIGLSLRLLIGFLLWGVAVLIGLVVSWTLVKIWRRRAGKSRAERPRAERLRPDGRALPPTGAGLCDRCQEAFDEVYHLPTGRRLCRHCFWGGSIPQTGQELEAR